MRARAKVLAAIDFSPVSERVVAEAGRLAGALRADLTLLHVRPPAIEGLDLRAALERTDRDLDADKAALESMARTFRDAGLDVFTRVLLGEPAPEILRETEIEDLDLLVLGTHGRRGVGRFLMGSVSEWLIRRCACPVVVVHPAPESRESANTHPET